MALGDVVDKHASALEAQLARLTLVDEELDVSRRDRRSKLWAGVVWFATHHSRLERIVHATNVLLQLVLALELSPALVTHVRLVLAVRQHVQAHLVCTRKRLLANRTWNLQVGVTDARVLLHTLCDE